MGIRQYSLCLSCENKTVVWGRGQAFSLSYQGIDKKKTVALLPIQLLLKIKLWTKKGIIFFFCFLRVKCGDIMKRYKMFTVMIRKVVTNLIGWIIFISVLYSLSRLCWSFTVQINFRDFIREGCLDLVSK